MDKYKSKLVKNDSEVVSWLELFRLSLYEEHSMEITLWTKDKQDICIGR